MATPLVGPGGDIQAHPEPQEEEQLEPETRSDYLIDMVRESRGHGTGPMGTHKTSFGTFCGHEIIMNLPVTLMGSFLLWGVAIACTLDPTGAKAELGAMQSYVTAFFTWAYIGSNGIWLFFLLGIYYYYGNVRLGKDSDKPEFDDANFFMMIFCAGVSIGLFYFGVSEPMFHYLQETGANRYTGAGYMNDNELATNAINLTLYHWGVHGWVVYTLTAIILGVLSYRYDLPLTYRTAFFPLFGKVTWGWMGDIIDSFTIAGCVAGVCTSLGLGAKQLVVGFQRIGLIAGTCPFDKDGNQIAGDECHLNEMVVYWRCILIMLITLVATFSVLSGLESGIQFLSQVAFCSGMFLWTCAMALDNTWYLLNVMVQAFGVYLQWILQLGWFTDAFGQLRFGGGRNIESEGTNPSWMDWWTIFYWGWWIAWSPFVGVFLAKISKGRTVSEVINFTFSVPMIYCLIWFSCFGGAGIKMHREGELLKMALEDAASNSGARYTLKFVPGDDHKDIITQPDNFTHGWITTKGGTTGSKCWHVPQNILCSSTDLAATKSSDVCPVWSNINDGNESATRYTPDTTLSPVCMFDSGHSDDIWFDLMDHYAGLGPLLSAFSIFTIVIYFVTSSDSGSLVVDLIACNGEEAHPITKVFWAFTEGGLACALLLAGGEDALSALRAVSIIAGVPFTVLVCLICLSIITVFQYDQGFMWNHQYNTWATQLYGGMLDWLEVIFSGGYAPKPDARHTIGFFGCLIVPPWYCWQTVKKLPAKSGLNAPGYTQLVGSAVSWVGFLVSLVMRFMFPRAGFGGLAAFCYGAFSIFVYLVRSEVRVLYNINGGAITDVCCALFMYPQTIWIAYVQTDEPLPDTWAPAPVKKGDRQNTYFGRVPSERVPDTVGMSARASARQEQAMAERLSARSPAAGAVKKEETGTELKNLQV